MTACSRSSECALRETEEVGEEGDLHGRRRPTRFRALLACLLGAKTESDPTKAQKCAIYVPSVKLNAYRKVIHSPVRQLQGRKDKRHF